MITIQESWIPILNIIIVGIFVYCFVRGWHHGFLRMILSLIGTLGAIYGAWLLAPLLEKKISIWPQAWTPMQDSIFSSLIYPVFNKVAWFFLLFILIKIIFFVLDKVLKVLQKLPLVKQAAEILGGVVGILEAVIWCVILSLILCTPLFSNGADAVDQSFLLTIQNTNNVVLNTVLKPIFETEDMLKLITDAGNAAKDQQDLLAPLIDNALE